MRFLWLGIAATLALASLFFGGSREYLIAVVTSFREKDAAEQIAIAAGVLSLFGISSWVGATWQLREVDAIRRQRDAAMDQVKAAQGRSEAERKQFLQVSEEVRLLEEQRPQNLLLRAQLARKAAPNASWIETLRVGLLDLSSPIVQSCRMLAEGLLQSGTTSDVEEADRWLTIASLWGDDANATIDLREEVQEARAAATGQSVDRQPPNMSATPVARAYGPAARAQVAGLLERGDALLSDGDYQAAERLFLRAKVEAEAGGLGDTRLWLTSWINYTQALVAAGKADIALTELSEALPVAEDVLGKDDPEYLLLCLIEGWTHISLNLGDAVALNEKVVAEYRQTLGPRHPDTLAAMHFLARAHLEVNGDFERAATIEKQTVKLRSEVLGPRHRTTLLSRALYAETQVRLGRFASVIRELDGLKRDTIKALGIDHPQTWDVQNLRAEALAGLGFHPEALREFEEILPKFESQYGAGNKTVSILREDYIKELVNAGESPKAEGLLNSADEEYTKLLGPKSPTVIRLRALRSSLGLRSRPSTERGRTIQ